MHQTSCIKPGVRGETRTRNNAASTARVYQLRHPNIGGQSRIRTSEIPKGYRVYSAALSASQPTAQSELSKIWRKAGDSNAYVPRDPGLADQWDTNYPSLPGTNSNLDLEGNYRLDERHQDCPTVSRYDRRPRLKKRRIYSHFTVESLFGQGLNGSGWIRRADVLLSAFAARLPCRSSANVIDQKSYALVIGRIQPEHALENTLSLLEPA